MAKTSNNQQSNSPLTSIKNQNYYERLTCEAINKLIDLVRYGSNRQARQLMHCAFIAKTIHHNIVVGYIPIPVLIHSINLFIVNCVFLRTLKLARKICLLKQLFDNFTNNILILKLII